MRLRKPERMQCVISPLQLLSYYLSPDRQWEYTGHKANFPIQRACMWLREFSLPSTDYLRQIRYNNSLVHYLIFREPALKRLISGQANELLNDHRAPQTIPRAA